MFTTGVPRNEHSLMPADELPTRQAACASSATKSFGRHVGDEAHVRGQLRMLLAHVAQAVGHLAGAGIGIGPEPDRRQVERRHHLQRGLEVRAVVGSVVTGCCTTIRNGCSMSTSWPTPSALTCSLVIVVLTCAASSTSSEPVLKT